MRGIEGRRGRGRKGQKQREGGGKEGGVERGEDESKGVVEGTVRVSYNLSNKSSPKSTGVRSEDSTAAPPTFLLLCMLEVKRLHELGVHPLGL